MIDILIVDDHLVIREGLTRILGMEEDMEVIGTANDAELALKFLAEEKVNIVLLDISMPGRSGLEIIQDIRQLQPDARVIMLSMYKEEQFAQRAFKSGAFGYLTKDQVPEEIINVIRLVQTGKKYFPAI